MLQDRGRIQITRAPTEITVRLACGSHELSLISYSMWRHIGNPRQVTAKAVMITCLIEQPMPFERL